MRCFLRIAPSAAIVAAGLTVSILGFQIIKQQEEAQIQLGFERNVDAYANILQGALGSVERELASVADLFISTEKVGFEEFRAFARPALDRNPGIWAITWVARVSAAEKEEFLHAARTEITPSFEFRQRDGDGNIVPAEARDEYFPILYTEAVVEAENVQAWGVDPMTDPNRSEAFTKAMDSGQRSATAPIIPLSSTSGPQTTIATIQPIYEKGEGVSTTRERRAAIKGFVVVVFRISILVEATLGDLRPYGLEFYLQDTISGDQDGFIYFHSSQGRSGTEVAVTTEMLRSGLHVDHELALANRVWSATFGPGPGLYVGSDQQAVMVLVSGLLLTGLLALYQQSILSRNIKISSQVARQTNALQQNEEKLIALNEELALERDRAEAGNRAKSEFLAAMSHELRTPLNAVIGFSEMISAQTFGPVGDDKYREYAEDISGAGTHLLDLINDILDLAKVEAGNEDIHEEEVDIGELLISVVGLVKGRAGQQEVQLKQEIQDNLPLIYLDVRKLKQILVNLLTNAIKFNDPGGTVTLKIWHSKDGFVFQVADTGIGIADEEIPKALSRFGQVNRDISRSQEGTGLGLPLTKALVELHGGSLDLQSRLNVGTTVTVRFPSARTVES